MTFVAALRHDGIVAPCVFDGPITSQFFGAQLVDTAVSGISPPLYGLGVKAI